MTSTVTMVFLDGTDLEEELGSKCRHHVHVLNNRCGADASGLMNGAHPTVADGKVIRRVGYNWRIVCCDKSNNIEVVNCGQYYVYKLNKTPGCYYRYCGSDN